MSDNNPYQPPKSAAGQNNFGLVTKKVSREKPLEMGTLSLLFKFKGRIGVRQFLSWYIPLGLVSFASLFFDTIVAKLTYLVLIYFFLTLGTKRCHDLGSRGWIGLCQIIPGLGWVIVLMSCGFSIGEFHDNRFGKSIYRK
jgi:uncharacterized membrane protein YhaH (DUF805 family)